MTTLVWGVASESPIARVCAELEDLAVEPIIVSPRRLADIDVELVVGGPRGQPMLDGAIILDDRKVLLAEVTGIYLRPIDPELTPGLAGRPRDDPAFVRARAAHEALVGFTEVAAAVTGCRVVNRLSSMGSNTSKPFQAQAALRHGFSVPATLVTDDPDEALAFTAEHGEVVYKSISGVRSIVTRFDPAADEERLARLRWCPVQFQERVLGPDVRVHVVGTEVYAARIETTAVDYRYARSQTGSDATLVRHELDDGVAERCVALAADLDLPFAGIDLKLSPDGRVVCFEVNPSPGFPWFEAAAGLPIAAAVARYLIGR